jgi:CRISPR-associated protein Cmr4
MKKHLLTLYTRTPLHVGSGTSVDVVDLPIMRERITGFPVIPATSLKGVLLQHARETFANGKYARSPEIPDEAKLLFGAIEGEGENQRSNAGCVQIMEAKILAFPVRSLAGCFAWLTCPTALERFQRDTGVLKDANGEPLSIPQPAKDSVIVPGDSQLTVPGQPLVVFEEYALATQTDDGTKLQAVAKALKKICADPLWSESLSKRLAIVHDENFQHFVTTCTEVVTRIAINPETRTVKGSAGEGGGALFNQENVPCETLFYSVLTVLPPRRKPDGDPSNPPDPSALFAQLLPAENPPILQIGGDETTGHGLCETKRIELNQEVKQ